MHRSTKIDLSSSRTLLQAQLLAATVIHTQPLPHHSPFSIFTYITINPRAVHIPYSVLIFFSKKGLAGWSAGLPHYLYITSFDHGDQNALLRLKIYHYLLSFIHYLHCV
jgi:hypothetical protein